MARRAHHEGSIYQRKDGRYVGQYHDGIKRRYTYGHDKEAVRVKLNKAVSDRDFGLVFDSENLTLGDYLPRWLESIRDSVQYGTWSRYEVNCRVHIIPALGNVKIEKLSPLQLSSLYRSKLDSGLSPRTVQYLHVTLHKALKQAMRWQMVPRNPVESVDAPKIVRREIEPLAKGQVRTLLDAARGERLYPLYALALTTGMREGELLALKWSDIDLDAGYLRVERTVYNGRIGPPKTNASRRTIKLPAKALAALRSHSRESSQWCFPTTTGTTYTCQNFIQRHWKPLLKRAGLPVSTRFHDTRHTVATLLLEKNVNVKHVASLLGHANVAVTLDVYQHHLRSHDSIAASAMDSLLEEDADDVV